MSAEGWFLRGACLGTASRDYDPFYPETGELAEFSKVAKRVCSGCPVRSDCLEEAMAEEWGVGRTYRHGIRGGLSPRQRVKREARHRKAQEPCEVAS